MFQPVRDAELKEAEASAKIVFKILRLCEMTPGLIVEIVEIFFVGFRFSPKHTTIIQYLSCKFVHVNWLRSCTLGAFV